MMSLLTPDEEERYRQMSEKKTEQRRIVELTPEELFGKLCV